MVAKAWDEPIGDPRDRHRTNRVVGQVKLGRDPRPECLAVNPFRLGSGQNDPLARLPSPDRDERHQGDVPTSEAYAAAPGDRSRAVRRKDAAAGPPARPVGRPAVGRRFTEAPLQRARRAVA